MEDTDRYSPVLRGTLWSISIWAGPTIRGVGQVISKLNASMTEEEMLDIAAMAQSSPGAIAVNAANLVGWRVGGFAGMLTSVIATIIPPMAILTVISIFYAAFASNPYVSQALRGMQAGVAAVILDVVCGLGIKEFHSHSALRLCILGAAFIAAFVLDVNVIYIILATALVGVISALAARKRGGAK